MLSHQVDKSDVSRFADMKQIFQKSVVSQVDIPEGAIITREMLGVKKPGTGLAPDRLSDTVGKRAKRAVPAHTVLQEHDIAWID